MNENEIKEMLQVSQEELDEILNDPQEIERCKSVNALVKLETMLFNANPFMPQLPKKPVKPPALAVGI